MKRILAEHANALRFSLLGGDAASMFSRLFQFVFGDSRKKILPGGVLAACSRLPGLHGKTEKERFRYYSTAKMDFPLSVVLAGKKHTIAASNGWKLPDGADAEEDFALHRFGWLLAAHAEGAVSPDQIDSWILDWIRANPSGNKIGWDSYSISERISNWVVMLSRLSGGAHKSSEPVRQSLLEQMAVLAENLEIRGTATNNHIINNGRALYLGGLFLGHAGFAGCGRELLAYGLERMFTRSGFLREGSSHYHILLARSYLEVCFYAEQKNDGFFSLIRERVERIWRCACFFLNEFPIPLFGDVSPDFPTDFHRGVPLVGAQLFNRQASCPEPDKPGWHSLLIDVPGNSHDKYEKHPLQIFDDAGYCRFANGRFSVYMHAPPLGYVPAWSHGHADTGGLIVYYEGQPLLIDTGRESYRNDTMSRYGRSVCSHNSVEIDGREPCLVHGLNAFPEIMPLSYISMPPVIHARESGDTCEIIVETYGFSRWRKGLVFRRKIFVCQEFVEIEDEFSGSGSIQARTFFHFAPALRLSVEGKDNRVGIISSAGWEMNFQQGGRGQKMEYFFGGSDDVPLGWASLEYGRTEPVHTLVYSLRMPLPAINKYRLSVE